LNSLSPSWYALQIRSRFEKMAAKQLSDKGYEVYLPLLTSKRPWSDRIKTVEMPLFPGYVFCRFDVQDKLPVLVVPGVLAIVAVGRNPAAIPASQIDAVRQVLASQLHCRSCPLVEAGQRIVVARGPLAGLEGTVVRVKSELRLTLSLPLLQRSIAVEIDRDCIDLDHLISKHSEPEIERICSDRRDKGA